MVIHIFSWLIIYVAVQECSSVIHIYGDSNGTTVEDDVYSQQQQYLLVRKELNNENSIATTDRSLVTPQMKNYHRRKNLSRYKPQRVKISSGRSFDLINQLLSRNNELLKEFRFVEPKSKQQHLYERLKRGSHGGWGCGACTVLVGMGEELANIHNETVIESLNRLCGFLPTELSSGCSVLMYTLGPAIMEYLTESSSPDLVCYKIGICKPEPNTCNLFPIPAKTDQFTGSHQLSNTPRPRPQLQDQDFADILPWLCYIPGVQQLCDLLDKAFHQLLPGLDADNDGHSPAETFRGSLWRGRDCHDGNPAVHPGKIPTDNDRLTDSNCNGIMGINETSGIAWEEELCLGTDPKGVIFIGDSVTAHFHLPKQWFQPLTMDGDTFVNITTVISNEGDWPDVGFATGFRNSTMPGTLDGKVDSLYLRMRNRNRCNHRDYHNLARNGANSTDTLTYIKALSRSQRDLPAIVFYSLLANDVCTEVPDPSRMMTPEEFRSNVIQVLDILQQHLAPGSHVVLVGLVDAAFLYETMAERYHPLGEYRKNIKYKDMYRWFNCMDIGPCSGWMNENATMRELTSQRSRELSNVLRNISETRRFSRFDIIYMDCPFQKVVADWVKAGGEVYQLIEPVDSLHPTQAAQSLITAEVWRTLETHHPHVLGPENTNNLVIDRLFGDQGGH